MTNQFLVDESSIVAHIFQIYHSLVRVANALPVYAEVYLADRTQPFYVYLSYS